MGIINPRPDILRMVPFTELRHDAKYRQLARLGPIFSHSVVETKDGKYIWDPNTLICHLFPKGRLDFKDFILSLMNKGHAGQYPPHELIKFTMQLGYELDEFIHLFAHRTAEWFTFITDAEDKEPLFDYLIRTLDNQILRL